MRAGFPHSEILGSKLACQLPEAYRRLQRPSSPVVAKASTTCTCSLDPITLSTKVRLDIHTGWRCRKAGYRSAWYKLLMQSLPRRIRSETPDPLHFFRIVKEQPNKQSSKRNTRRRAFGFELQNRKLVEPTGIEPVTSCLQSRRSPS